MKKVKEYTENYKTLMKAILEKQKMETHVFMDCKT